jgi:hypothetical protein
VVEYECEPGAPNRFDKLPLKFAVPAMISTPVPAVVLSEALKFKFAFGKYIIPFMYDEQPAQDADWNKAVLVFEGTW